VRSPTFILFACSASLLAGQSSMPGAAEAEYLFAHKRYVLVTSHYENLLAKDSLSGDLNYKLGVCYMNSRSQKEKAIPCFRRALKAGLKDQILSEQVSKQLADACYASGYYEEAIQHYENYKTFISPRKEAGILLHEINKQIEICVAEKELSGLKELVASMIHSRFMNPEDHSGAPGFDYSSSSSAGKLSIVFTLRSANKKRSDVSFFEDTLISLPAEMISTQNKDTASLPCEATVATSVDGQFMLTYRNEDGHAQLYTSVLQGNSWSSPQKLDRVVNNKGWEPDEFVSADGSTLYFTSERPGGYGGKDIYKCTRLPNGEWSKAVNSGYPVNTSFDDEAPFIHPDGVTLFFSSNRAKSKKDGFDVFTSTFYDNTWSKARNVGYPFDKTRIEKSTLTAEPPFNRSRKENYLVTFPNTNNIPLTLVKGKILSPSGNPVPGLKITIIDNETGDTTGVYHPDAGTGQYIFILPPAKNSQVVYEAAGYLFHTENMDSRDTALYRLHPIIELAPLVHDSKEFLNNTFFNDGLASLHPQSFFELNTLYNFAMANPAFRIELSTWHVRKDKDRAAEKLQAERLRFISDYLLGKGIGKDRIQTRVLHSSKKRKNKNPLPPLENKIQIRYWK